MNRFFILFFAALIALFFIGCASEGEGGGSGGGGGGGEKETEWTVIFYNDGKIEQRKVPIALNTLITLPSPTKSEFIFGGWRENNSGEPKLGRYIVKGNVVFFASWIPLDTTLPDQYILSFYNGSTPLVDLTDTALSGETVVLPLFLAPAGYIFEGWLKDNSELVKDTFTVTGDAVFYSSLTPADPAVSPNIYNIAFYDGNLFLASLSVTAEEGKAITLPIYSKANHTFNGWKIDGAGSSIKGSYTVRGNVRFFADLTLRGNYPIERLVRYYDGTELLYSVSVTHGTNITLPSPVRLGSVFNGWRKDNRGALLNANYTVVTDLDFYTDWTITHFMINFYDQYGTFLEDISVLMQIGNSMPLPPYTVPTAYSFQGWRKGGIDSPITGSYTVSGTADFYPLLLDTVTCAPSNPAEVVLINSAEELISAVSETDGLSKHYKLTADLLPAGVWTPIGSSAEPFTGTFDGNGFKAAELRIETDGDAGFFRELGEGARVCNLFIETAEAGITGSRYVGGVAGYAAGTSSDTVKIANSHILNGVISSSHTRLAYAGGFVGYAYMYVEITGSSNAAKINCTIDAGGILGFAGEHITISDSWNKGSVTSSGRSAGGIAGEFNEGMPDINLVTNSFNIGTIIATSTDPYAYSYSGGIIGVGNNVADSYNAGSVSSVGGSAYAGGIAGSGNNISASYNLGVVNSNSDTAAFAGGITGRVSSSGFYGTSAQGVSASYNKGSVSAVSTGTSASAGGIAGLLSYGSIKNSYNTGSIYAEAGGTGRFLSANAGGIAGKQDRDSISESYNIGSVTAASRTGRNVYAAGIVGNMSGNFTVINNAAAGGAMTGTTTGTITINRVLAYSSVAAPTVQNNFASKEITGHGGDFAGNPIYSGIEKSAAELKRKSSYTALGWLFGNDADNTWVMPSPDGSDYPHLYFEK
jgi:hypothetical protein